VAAVVAPPALTRELRRVDRLPGSPGASATERPAFAACTASASRDGRPAISAAEPAEVGGGIEVETRPRGDVHIVAGQQR
jgi:hypothetical protein